MLFRSPVFAKTLTSTSSTALPEVHACDKRKVYTPEVFKPVTLVFKLFGETIVTPAVDGLPPGDGAKLNRDHVGFPEKLVVLVPVNDVDVAQTVKFPPAFTEQLWALATFVSPQ